MMIRTQNQTVLTVSLEQGCITSLRHKDAEWLADTAPLFTIRMRDASGTAYLTNAFEAQSCRLTASGAVYSGFPYDITATVVLDGDALADWRIHICNRTAMVIEWVEFPTLILKPLAQNGGEASMLLPYNEGVLIDDAQLRQESWFPHAEPEYPSHGSYYMFPYMLSSQFMCYLDKDCGLYMGAHDTERGVKGLQVYPVMPDGAASGYLSHLYVSFRLFTGCDFGADYSCDYPIVWHSFTGSWYDGAAIYKEWFQQHLPANVCKIRENPALPDWYEDAPLVITYPVRGIHDMDRMEPNALFPYENALPLIEEIAAATDCRILVLLMHWEGTAPWAPPYVWPPYGGEACLNRFLDALHRRGHLLGVYCSGFGWTLKSNLVDSYDNTAAYGEQHLEEAMCAGPDGRVAISRICPGQRSGYDLCAASVKAQEILDQAYRTLLESQLDYAQILDQNHGGSQYFCYSRSHGHPPVPGSWMTSNMQDLLGCWQKTAGSLLLGCESAAAEPYIGNLLLSDNRYELNWHIGQPVPLYAFLYHEYLHNFMGNQVCCAFSDQADTMCARLAYSFTAGDCMTLVLTPDGQLMVNWGCHDFSRLPDKKRALTFIANLRRFYRKEAGPYLYAGNMIKPLEYHCTSVIFPSIHDRDISLPSVLSSAWELDGKRLQIFVNHTGQPVTVETAASTFAVPALNAIAIPLP